MITLKWPQHKYVLTLIMLFLMLNRSPNRGSWLGRPMVANCSICCALMLLLGACWGTLSKLWESIRKFNEILWVHHENYLKT